VTQIEPDPLDGLTPDERARQEEMQRMNSAPRAEVAEEEAPGGGGEHPEQSAAYLALADEEKERLLRRHEQAMEGPAPQDDET
jgi:hypothetical protein